MANQKIFMVEYRYAPGVWKAMTPFSDREAAETYRKQQIRQSQGGINGTLNGLGEDDFRIQVVPITKAA
jgi:ribosomal protein S3AE